MFIDMSNRPGYNQSVKQIWTGRAAQLAGKYGESAPAATACCNACRTCVTTNLVALGAAAAGAIGIGAVRIARRTLGYSRR
jgi:hypothetical protein